MSCVRLLLLVLLSLVPHSMGHEDEQKHCPCNECVEDVKKMCEKSLHKDLIVTTTQRTVVEVMDTLVELLEDENAYPGFNVVARINHGQAAENVELDLPPTEVLIFGNPKAGTKLMQDTPSTAIDLPLRIIAWRDQGQNTKVGYYSPVYLATHHCVRKDFTELLCNMAGLLENLVQLATAD